MNPSPKLALFATTAMAVLFGTAFATAQESYPISGDQFGYGERAVAETSFNLELFGGGDENGGTYGGAPTITIPLGDSLGLQVDGVAGFAADEAGFAGGAAQLFFRDPQSGLIGVAGGGYYVEGTAQYAVAGIAEYYLDSVTLEALVGYQTGDVMDGAYGRAGISIYANPNLRIGGGVSYSEETEIGGDIQLEALLTDIPGMALFATGVFDQQGSMGYGGVKFYFNSATNLLATDRTKQAGGPTLIDMHRNLGRPNFFTSGGAGFGLRQISLVGSALNGGDPFGDIDPDPETPDGDTANCGDGAICAVQDLVDNLTEGTVLEPLNDLIVGLLDPNDGALSALTGALEDLTSSDDGALGAVTDLVNALVNTQDQALEPLISGLNDILAGLTGGLTGGLSSNALGDFMAADGTTDEGLIDVVQDTVANLLDGTPLEGVGDLVDGLVDPDTGALAALTGQLNELTSEDAGALGPVTGLVDALVDPDVGALDPVLDGVNDLLEGLLGGLAGGLSGDGASLSGLTGLLGGLGA
ncbi:hypothetical protein L2U69_10715 [Zavarzinia compransoris]|uniref:hypothetical protein n=1 Tax=Zavarzinia marina TaxID=2911065 RepID=UPI001F262C2C|nr:hypothetical protein [Zavarzinia marina]MCF4166115.1 hypothetical protein [Zavarzinia marina]